ncbi:hypothetical protein GGR57DRAFT_487361 [Xylariaceae sp. FL1272]|nr:hypothetical protein GGR57DRAFT_487361 [Xylariaceae sp. FL1272]
MAPNTASLLPLIPRIFFVYIEPVCITYGAMLQYATSHELFSLSSSASSPLSTPALVVPGLSATYLFSMMLYGLMILLATPPSKRLLKLHIWVLIIADFTHWFALLSTIARNDPRGWAAILDTKGMDPDTWQLLTYPVGTLFIKFATLLGLFGQIKG